MSLIKNGIVPRKIICGNIWRDRKVCITFALANDREADASERGGRERKGLRKRKPIRLVRQVIATN